MRKVSPQDVRDDFTSQLADLKRFYLSGMAGLANDKDHSTLTEHSLLAAAVAWEGFISDLFVAYINVDAARFKVHLQAAFNEHIKTQDKPYRVFEKFGRLTMPTHLTKADVQALANSSGNNITFSNYADLEKRAATWLIEAHANRFRTLPGPQKAVVNAVIALRNHIAHRSQRSLDAMNAALAAPALQTTGIRRGSNKFHNVGAWLKATPARRTEPRIVTIMASLESIGAAC